MMNALGFPCEPGDIDFSVFEAGVIAVFLRVSREVVTTSPTNPERQRGDNRAAAVERSTCNDSVIPSMALRVSMENLKRL